MSDEPYEIVHPDYFPELKKKLKGKPVVFIKDPKRLVTEQAPKPRESLVVPVVLGISIPIIALLSVLVVLNIVDTTRTQSSAPEVVEKSEVEALREQLGKVASVTKFLVSQSKVMHEVVTSQPPPKEAAPFKPQLIGRFIADKVRIRREPSPEASVIATVALESEIAVKHCENDWCSVSAPNGEEGWVASEYLQVTYTN